MSTHTTEELRDALEKLYGVWHNITAEVGKAKEIMRVYFPEVRTITDEWFDPINGAELIDRKVLEFAVEHAQEEVEAAERGETVVYCGDGCTNRLKLAEEKEHAHAEPVCPYRVLEFGKDHDASGQCTDCLLDNRECFQACKRAANPEGDPSIAKSVYGKCWDCGSTIHWHHTPSCALAPEEAIRDLNEQPGTKWWDGTVPVGVKS